MCLGKRHATPPSLEGVRGDRSTTAPGDRCICVTTRLMSPHQHDQIDSANVAIEIFMSQFTITWVNCKITYCHRVSIKNCSKSFIFTIMKIQFDWKWNFIIYFLIIRHNVIWPSIFILVNKMIFVNYENRFILILNIYIFILWTSVEFDFGLIEELPSGRNLHM